VNQVLHEQTITEKKAEEICMNLRRIGMGWEKINHPVSAVNYSQKTTLFHESCSPQSLIFGLPLQ
jgi:hypothetical protein